MIDQSEIWYVFQGCQNNSQNFLIFVLWSGTYQPKKQNYVFQENICSVFYILQYGKFVNISMFYIDYRWCCNISLVIKFFFKKFQLLVSQYRRHPNDCAIFHSNRHHLHNHHYTSNHEIYDIRYGNVIEESDIFRFLIFLIGLECYNNVPRTGQVSTSFNRLIFFGGASTSQGWQ